MDVVALIAIIVPARVVGWLKFGCIPGGGGIDGTFDRSRPCGRTEFILNLVAVQAVKEEEQVDNGEMNPEQMTE